MAEVKVSAQIFRNLYIDLYSQLRNYLWDIETVQIIADLEIETHKAFPDVSLISTLTNRLKYYIMSTMSEDEDMKEAFDALQESLEENKDFVVFLRQPIYPGDVVDEVEDEEELEEELDDIEDEDEFNDEDYDDEYEEPEYEDDEYDEAYVDQFLEENYSEEDE
jgi:hypothetical protein